MTDAELAEFLAVDLADVPKIPPAHRATYERMATVTHELNLWTAGLGPKPAGVIVCHERKGRRR